MFYAGGYPREHPSGSPGVSPQEGLGTPWRLFPEYPPGVYPGGIPPGYRLRGCPGTVCQQGHRLQPYQTLSDPSKNICFGDSREFFSAVDGS